MKGGFIFYFHLMNEINYDIIIKSDTIESSPKRLGMFKFLRAGGIAYLGSETNNLYTSVGISWQ